MRTATAATYAEFGPRGLGASAAATCREDRRWPRDAFDVEDLSTAFLRLSGGATLLLECSWAQWVPEDQCYVTVYGADGGAGINWVPGRRRTARWRSGPSRTATGAAPAAGDAARRGAPGDAWSTSSSWCGPGQPVHGRQALARSAVVDACYASAEAGREVALPVSALA